MILETSREQKRLFLTPRFTGLLLVCSDVNRSSGELLSEPTCAFFFFLVEFYWFRKKEILYGKEKNIFIFK